MKKLLALILCVCMALCVVACNDTKKDPAPAAEAEGGCGASVAAMGVALVAALGTCTAFICKKR